MPAVTAAQWILRSTMNNITESHIAAQCSPKFRQAVVHQRRGRTLLIVGMLSGFNPLRWSGVCTDPCSVLGPSSNSPSPRCPRDPVADAALGMLGLLRAGRVAAPPPGWPALLAGCTAPGGALQREETARGGAARSRAAAQLFPPFPPRGEVPGLGGEETRTRAQSRVPGRRRARVPTAWLAPASRPLGAPGAPNLSR